MRPRQLRLTAFGPFADPVEIDFDRLADTGLFVVAGPTGAGKTSLFDGVCFALYGRLAGHRDAHGDVRSQHAVADRPTEVVLEFDAAGDRWRVWRHPRQERPKRRGTGMTTAPPQARLEQWRDNAWHPVESRWDLATQRCRQLVGLDAEQFQQVVLLPQGRFQEVLNARSADRQALLRTLFRSQLYRRGQDALDAMAREVGQALDAVDQQRRAHLTATREALEGAVAALQGRDVILGEAVPEPVDVEAPDAAARLATALEGLGTGPVAELDRARRRGEAGAAAAADAASRAEQVAALVEGRDQLEGCWQAVEAEAAERAGQRATVELARRAAPVGDADEVVSDCRTGLDRALRLEHDAWEEARAACGAAGLDLRRQPDEDAAERARFDAEVRAKELLDLSAMLQTAEACDEAAERIDRDAAAARQRRQELVDRRAADAVLVARLGAERERLARLADDRPVRAGALAAAVQRSELGAELTRVTVLLTESVGERDHLDRRVTQLEAQLAQHAEARDEARLVAGGEAVARGLAEQCRRRLERRQAAAAAEAELVAAEAAVSTARADADAAFARFVDGAAPRLAARLAPGSPCPVCGSAGHPAPASAPTGSRPPELPDLERSSRRAADAEGRRSGAAAILAALRSELGPQAERPLDELRQAVDAADQQLERCIGAAERLATLDRQLSRRRDDVDGVRQQRSALQDRIDAATTRRSELLGALGPDRQTDRRALRADVDAARRQLAEADAAAAGLDQLARDRRALEQRTEDAGAELDELRDRCARLSEQASAGHRRADELRTEVRAEVGDASPRDLAALAGRAGEAAAEARRRVAHRAEADRALAAAARRLRCAVEAGGFTSADEALAAVREPAEVARLDDVARRWERRHHEIRAGLDALAAHPLPATAPDVDALQARAGEVAERSASLVELTGQVAAQLAHARRGLDQVRALDARGEATQARARLVRTTAEVVRGRNGRNVTLEAWVLASHLREVVGHANHHLATMSRGRYQLAVSDAVSDARARSGLDLVVDDAFTGATRPTVSLSGGEMFQAALALALGLADVVTAGRAGLQLDALFIDEGFGSLDVDALEQAIDVLDGLRSRGALVGVVTHVESLKDALPVAIEVRPRPDRRGSTVHQAP